MERQELLRRLGLTEADLGDERLRKLVDDPALQPLVEAALVAGLDAEEAALRLDYGAGVSLLARASGEGAAASVYVGPLEAARGRGATLRDALSQLCLPAHAAAMTARLTAATLAAAPEQVARVMGVTPDMVQATLDRADALDRLASALEAALGSGCAGADLAASPQAQLLAQLASRLGGEEQQPGSP